MTQQSEQSHQSRRDKQMDRVNYFIQALLGSSVGISLYSLYGWSQGMFPGLTAWLLFIQPLGAFALACFIKVYACSKIYPDND